MKTGLKQDIIRYWKKRARGYSKVNQQELESDQKRKWSSQLIRQIEQNCGSSPNEIAVLDIGTGPGFFAIILAEAGYRVTAIDQTAAMISEAKQNAGRLAEQICFKEMDAHQLKFQRDSFDVIVSRNLTWNLEDPGKAYQEWIRVLKPGGILLNFDANWYRYLYDEQEQAAYEADRKQVQELALEDHYLNTDIPAMEEIARKVPLSTVDRPLWDLQQLTGDQGLSVEVNETIWKEVWSEEEKINYSATPMFLISVKKRAVK